MDLRGRHLEFWTPFSDGHLLESTTTKRLLLTSGAHCLHNELWLPILLIGFPGTHFLTFLEMSFAVWLYWNRNLNFHSFPYLRLMWGWWWCPGWKTWSLDFDFEGIIDSKLPTTWENLGNWKKKGSKRVWFDREKEARGEAFKGNRFRRKKLNPKISQGSCARKTGVAELNRGWNERTEAWIPTIPKEQPDTKAREARSHPG